jgi:hypothetical protein
MYGVNVEAGVVPLSVEKRSQPDAVSDKLNSVPAAE